jgi:MerR family mercuric resistance operon transcriptional regulator
MERRKMNGFTIGTLAKQAHVNLETIRFYERKGILPQPTRLPSGYRSYTEEDLRRLRFIQMAKKHGFSLNEIKELLHLRVDPDCTCDDVRRRAEHKIQVIEEKIQELDQMRRALKDLVASCVGVGPVGECPILDAFEKNNGKNL